MGLVQPIKYMMHKKRSKNAIFLGCGPSINDITEEQWAKIKNYDIWSINNWIYHPTVVPNFYHVELKYYDYPIFMEHLNKKWEMYKDTNFFCPESFRVKYNGKRLTLCEQFNMPNCYSYTEFNRSVNTLGKAVQSRQSMSAWGTHAHYAFDKKHITKSYNISLTSVLEVMCRTGYRTIIMYGVDLNNSYYFWTGKDYGPVHHQTNKEHEGKDPKLPHNTYIVAGFIVDFNKRHMLPNKSQLVVGHKNTLLYPKLEYVDILSV